jgi:hypothetical protein
MRRNTDKAKNPVKNIRVSPICVYKISKRSLTLSIERRFRRLDGFSRIKNEKISVNRFFLAKERLNPCLSAFYSMTN